MKRILITGVNSFVGCALEKRLARFPDKYSVEKISLRDDGWKSADISGFDCVVHVAGIAHVPYSKEMDARYAAVNRELTLEIARAAKSAGIPHFIFMSSMIVYGSAAPAGATRVISYDTPAAPENAYGQSKLDAENGLFSMADDGFSVAAVRSPTVYGKGCRGAYRTISKMAGRLPVFPRCRGLRSVIYVENLAEFIRRAIDERAEGLLFPQDAQYVATSDFVRQIRACHGKKTLITPIFAPFIAAVARTGAARKIFGGIVYEQSMSQCAENYRLYTLEKAVGITEED